MDGVGAKMSKGETSRLISSGQISKELHILQAGALDYINQGETDRARKLLEDAGKLALYAEEPNDEAVNYHPLATLDLQEGDPVQALRSIEAACAKFTESSGPARAEELRAKIALHVIQEGLALAASGDNVGALELFRQVQSVLNGKRRKALDFEIACLEEELKSAANPVAG